MLNTTILAKIIFMFSIGIHIILHNYYMTVTIVAEKGNNVDKHIHASDYFSDKVCW